MRRLRAVLVLQGETARGLAVSLGMSETSLVRYMAGTRWPVDFSSQLVQRLGLDAFSFVIGATDVLDARDVATEHQPAQEHA